MPISNLQKSENINTPTIVNSGLQLEYRFTETTITDYSGNNRTGQSGNSSATDSQDVTPIDWLNVGVDFIDDNYIACPSGIYFPGAFTVETCLFLRDYAAWARIFDFGNGQANENVLLSSSNNGSGRLHLDIIANGQFSSPVVAPFSTKLLEWVYICVSFSSGTGKIYINNSLQARGNLLTPSNLTRNNNFLGRSNWNGEAYLNGCLSLFRIYNRELSNTERTDNFKQSRLWLADKGIIL
ncbi:LamG domain-containing protein [Calothrix sp. 336/3]|uniref:LamG domain-containing protein n=1 Tax=Calothrix sp. 336/3 TaxID=1337936 RepID=UPI00062438DD|nr:LamG domain-containing protein [Calothrix sp. 336/3]AKG21268.1 hypothetical protein IJ00_08115 [Calothrix sp. 336/3]